MQYDLEASRDRTYFYCDNPAHAGIVRQTFFTQPETILIKCIGCGAVMAVGKYTEELEIGWFRVTNSGEFVYEIRALDPTQAKFVMKIQKLIQEAKAGTVPRALVRDLIYILEDYFQERIKTLGDLRDSILRLADKTALTL